MLEKPERRDLEILPVYNPHNKPFDVFINGKLLQDYVKIIHMGTKTDVYLKPGRIKDNDIISYKFAREDRYRKEYRFTPDNEGYIILDFNPNKVSNFEVYLDGIRETDIKENSLDSRLTYFFNDNKWYLFSKVELVDKYKRGTGPHRFDGANTDLGSHVTIMYGNQVNDTVHEVQYTSNIITTKEYISPFFVDLWADGYLLSHGEHYNIVGDNTIYFHPNTKFTNLIIEREKFKELYPYNTTGYRNKIIPLIKDTSIFIPPVAITTAPRATLPLLAYANNIYFTTNVEKKFYKFGIHDRSDLPFDISKTFVPHGKLALGDFIQGSIGTNHVERLYQPIKLNDTSHFARPFLIGVMRQFRIYNNINQMMAENKYISEGDYIFWERGAPVKVIDGNKDKGKVLYGDKYVPVIKHIMDSESVGDYRATPKILVSELHLIKGVLTGTYDYSKTSDTKITYNKVLLFRIEPNGLRTKISETDTAFSLEFKNIGFGKFVTVLMIKYDIRGTEYTISKESNKITVLDKPKIIIDNVTEYNGEYYDITTHIYKGTGCAILSHRRDVLDASDTPIKGMSSGNVEGTYRFQIDEPGQYRIRYTLTYSVDGNVRPLVVTTTDPLIIKRKPAIDALIVTRDKYLTGFDIKYAVASAGYPILETVLFISHFTSGASSTNLALPFYSLTLDPKDIDVLAGVSVSNLNEYGAFIITVAALYEDPATGNTQVAWRASNPIELYDKPKIESFTLVKENNKIKLDGIDQHIHFDNKPYYTDVVTSTTLTTIKPVMIPVTKAGFEVQQTYDTTPIPGSREYQLTAKIEYKMYGAQMVPIVLADTIFIDKDNGTLISAEVTGNDESINIRDIKLEAFTGHAEIDIAILNGRGVLLTQMRGIVYDQMSGSGVDIKIGPGDYHVLISAKNTRHDGKIVDFSNELDIPVSVYTFPYISNVILSMGTPDPTQNFNVDIHSIVGQDDRKLKIDKAGSTIQLFKSHLGETENGLPDSLKQGIANGVNKINTRTPVINLYAVATLKFTIDGVVHTATKVSNPLHVFALPTITAVAVQVNKGVIDIINTYSLGIGVTITSAICQLLDEHGNPIMHGSSVVPGTIMNSLSGNAFTVTPQFVADMPHKVMAKSTINYISYNNDGSSSSHTVTKSSAPVQLEKPTEPTILSYNIKSVPVKGKPESDNSFVIDMRVDANKMDVDKCYVFAASAVDTTEVVIGTKHTTFTAKVDTATHPATGTIRLEGTKFLTQPSIYPDYVAGTFHMYLHTVYTDAYGVVKTKNFLLGSNAINSDVRLIENTDGTFINYRYEFTKESDSPNKLIIKLNAITPSGNLTVTGSAAPVGTVITNDNDGTKINAVTNRAGVVNISNITKNLHGATMNEKFEIPLSELPELFGNPSGIPHDVTKGINIEASVSGATGTIHKRITIPYPQFVTRGSISLVSFTDHVLGKQLKLNAYTYDEHTDTTGSDKFLRFVCKGTSTANYNDYDMQLEDSPTSMIVPVPESGVPFTVKAYYRVYYGSNSHEFFSNESNKVTATVVKPTFDSSLKLWTDFKTGTIGVDDSHNNTGEYVSYYEDPRYEVWTADSNGNPISKVKGDIPMAPGNARHGLVSGVKGGRYLVRRYVNHQFMTQTETDRGVDDQGNVLPDIKGDPIYIDGTVVLPIITKLNSFALEDRYLDCTVHDTAPEDVIQVNHLVFNYDGYPDGIKVYIAETDVNGTVTNHKTPIAVTATAHGLGLDTKCSITVPNWVSSTHRYYKIMIETDGKDHVAGVVDSSMVFKYVIPVEAVVLPTISAVTTSAQDKIDVTYSEGVNVNIISKRKGGQYDRIGAGEYHRIKGTKEFYNDSYVGIDSATYPINNSWGIRNIGLTVITYEIGGNIYSIWRTSSNPKFIQCVPSIQDLYYVPSGKYAYATNDSFRNPGFTFTQNIDVTSNKSGRGPWHSGTISSGTHFTLPNPQSGEVFTITATNHAVAKQEALAQGLHDEDYHRSITVDFNKIGSSVIDLNGEHTTTITKPTRIVSHIRVTSDGVFIPAHTVNARLVYDGDHVVRTFPNISTDKIYTVNETFTPNFGDTTDFHCWVKSDNHGSVRSIGHAIPISVDYKKMNLTYNNSTKKFTIDVDLVLISYSNVYVKCSIHKGNDIIFTQVINPASGSVYKLNVESLAGAYDGTYELKVEYSGTINNGYNVYYNLIGNSLHIVKGVL